MTHIFAQDQEPMPLGVSLTRASRRMARRLDDSWTQLDVLGDPARRR